MKKILIFIMLGVFTSLLVISNVHASDVTNWTLEGDYYYYNHDIIIDDGLSINLSEEMPGKVVEYSYNQADFIKVVSTRIDNKYYLTFDVEGHYPNNISNYDVKINDDLIATIGVELGNPETIDLRLRVSASPYIDEPPVNSGGLWHVVDGNRAYVHMRYVGLDNNSNANEVIYETKNNNLFDDPDNNGYGLEYKNHYTYFVGRGSDNDLRPYFPNQDNLYEQSINNPFIGTNTTFTLEILYALDIENRLEGESNYKKIIIEDANSVSIQMEMITGSVSSTNGSAIYVVVDGSIVFDTYLYNSQWEEMDIPRVAMYFSEPEVVDVIDPINQVSWNALPLTLGNPTNPLGDWADIQDFSFDEATSRLSFTVNYLDELYQVNPFTVSANTDFLTKAQKIFYYSDPVTNDRILYVNFSEDESTYLLKNSSYDDLTVWKGEALWNLTQNEVQVTEARTVYNYIPEVIDGQVYSYFYMPDVPVDNLISVTANLSYQYYTDGFLGIGDLKPGEVENMTVIATKDETSSINPTWVESTYRSMYISSAVATAITITGVINPIFGLGVAGAFLLSGGILNVADNNEWFAKDIDQIQHVIPDQQLTSDINSYIREKSDNDSFNPSTDKLYKLHLATLDKEDDVKVLKDLSNVTQVVWETDGEIFVIDEQNINDPGWSGPGTETPTDNNDSLDWLFQKVKDAFDKYPEALIIVIIVVALIVATIAVSVSKGLKKGLKSLKTPIGLIVFLVVILLGIVMLG